MLKKLLLISSVLTLTVAAQWYASGATEGKAGSPKDLSRLERLVKDMPDSMFGAVEMENLLDEAVYLDLARDGWTAEEIMSVMKPSIADKKGSHYNEGYIKYAKTVLPIFRRMVGGDTLARIMDTVFTAKMRASVAEKVPEDLLNHTWPPKEYVPPRDRVDNGTGIREPGYFKNPKFVPSCGRICWIALHPTDHNSLYVAPDGAGLFKTTDCGKHWECISDNIPVRADRSCVNGYSIPVDPDDWDHVFGFMNNSAVYETCDGGQSWRKIKGATHKGFKRGDCFRDAEGNLKFIGCTRTDWYSTLWISEDTCKTWTAVEVPDSIKDIHPSGGYRGLWFQYIVTDPTDRNKIYLPTSRSILYFDDGAKSEIVNGKRVYNIKKMHFRVNDEAGNRRYANHSADRGADETNDAIFPCPANCVGDLVINPNEPNQWWFATGSNCCGMGDCSAVYKSEDGGKTWTTLQDLAFRIGSGCVFGNELANVWLGGFGVNFKDQSKLYGCSMSSAKSSDGGKTFQQFSWAIPLRAEHTDGRFITVSASRHNADNHCIRSHASGRVFRGSDGGMFMIDPEVNGGEWTQIGGDMGQMLFYHVAVNEFGDQVIAGNTQDIDGQTYRYGRWGSWRGYEGSESFINPYTSAVYFAGMGSVGWEGMPVDSWFNAQTKADVVSGSWYLTRAGISGMAFNRCDDLGKTVVKLQPKIGDGVGWLGKFGLCRDSITSTVYVITSSNKVKKSTDNGETWEFVIGNDGNLLDVPGRVLATDPNNPDVLYFGQNNAVWRYQISTRSWERLGGSTLPNIPCTQLLYHEGSGDLYFYHSGSAGIYLLECLDKKAGTYADSWKYWTKGYNSGKSTNVEINYTTQEMVICDYGRGVWVADLEHPADRFFDDGFKLKEYSFKDGRRTIGIDTQWTIPLYYYFKWTVNDEEVDCPYQYMRRALNPGDRVKLVLTLRESPDVSTVSEEFIVPEIGTPTDIEKDEDEKYDENQAPVKPVEESYNTEVPKEPGMALYSNGRGRVDLGYYDYFFNDFTIDFWIKPISDGTILANCTRTGDPKGWVLSIQSGRLQFQYSPRNVVNQPRYEAGITQTETVSGGSVEFGAWNHVAVVHTRFNPGQIKLYLNGRCVATGNRIVKEATLNNSMILSLFGDGIERNTLEASIDELKIWSIPLSDEQVRREMHSTNADDKDGLVAYWPFNGGSLENDLEMFTRRAAKSRVLAETTHPLMTVPTCARYVSYVGSASSDMTFKDGETDVLTLSKSSGATGEGGSAPAATNLGSIGVFAFNASQWQNEEDNLDTDYFDYHPVGFFIEPFDGVSATDDMVIDFHPVEGEFDPRKTYRVYATSINGDKQVWENVGKAEYYIEGNEAAAAVSEEEGGEATEGVESKKGCVRLTGVKLSDVVKKKLLIVMTKPSVELKIEGIGADGVLSIYDESSTSFPLSANILSGFKEPKEMYTINSDADILKPSGLYFVDGKASGELHLDLSKLGELNSSVRTTLYSSDHGIENEDGTQRASLIPLNIEVRNRIAPREGGTAMKIVNGYAGVGTTTNYKGILSNKNMTVMGWIRIDSAKVFSGDYSLLTFRDTQGVTGLRLRNGAFLFSQNGRDIWCWESNFKVTAATALDRWHHYALTFGNGGIRFYLDGMPFMNTGYTAATTSGIGTFYLGKNSGQGTWSSNEDKFCGAYDQVAAWNRELTQDEIIKYMYQSVPLNDNALLAYLNMDYTDEEGHVRDVYNCEELKTVGSTSLGGSVSFGEPTPIPFDARAFYNNGDAASPVTIEFPAGKNRAATITTFRGAPYCFLNHDFQNYSALNQEFYAVTYKALLGGLYPIPANSRPAETDSVTLTYRHRTILGDEPIAVAMRRTGTLDHLAGFIPAKSIEQGVATFRVPLSYLVEGSEIMFFTYPSEEGGEQEGRPAVLQLSFPQSIMSRLVETDDAETPVLVLGEDESSIPVIADVMALSRNYDSPVDIVVNETSYAKVSQETINFGRTENKFNVVLDMNKIDRFGINDLTLSLQGATSNELKLKFYLEPYVQLTLKNGDHRETVKPNETKPDGSKEPGETLLPDEPINNLAQSNAKGRKKPKTKANEVNGNDDGNTFRTKTSVANLEIDAQLVRGYMPEGQQVELEVVTELDNSLIIGNGDLLKNDNVVLDELEHHDASTSDEAYHEGWNLVGNPYLTNINLTKSQNVGYDSDAVTKYLYQCDPETGNYKVFDMTSYDEGHQIHPFQSYFVQTMDKNATLTITPVAKEEHPSKRTMAYSYEAIEAKYLEFELVGPDDKVYDRIILHYEDEADDAFVVNEDAAKFWNINGTSPEIYTVTADGRAAAVNTTNSETVHFEVKSPTAGTLKLRLVGMTGLGDYELSVKDLKGNQTWKPNLESSTTYTFSTDAVNKVPKLANGKRRAGEEDLGTRFEIGLEHIVTGANGPKEAEYRLVTEDGTCTITGLKGDAEVRIFKPNGLNVVNAKTSEPSMSVNLEPGVYIVIIRENGKEYTSKILV